MGLSPRLPDPVELPKPPEELPKTVPEPPAQPESQPELVFDQARADSEAPNFVQGLDLYTNTSPLVGDSLDLAQAEEARPQEPEQPIPTDRLILENGGEAHVAGENTQTSEEPASEPEKVEVPSALLRSSRIDLLTAAIEKYPQSPANYVLRGEAYLDQGDDALAERDFLTALELAEQGAETADWGYIHRAFYDRAKEGLRHCR